MKKIILFIFIVGVGLVFACCVGYFGGRYILSNYLNPEELFLHPRIISFFNLTPTCSTTCVQGGVCGKDGKNYCNMCVAFQNRAGFAYEGPCLKTYTNNIFGFSISFTDSWSDYQVVQSSWDGQLINTETHYKGEKLIFKNPKLATENNFAGIPVMIITPEVWKLISEEKVAVSAAPIGPEKIGENSKYVFAIPPRWYGFADNLDQDKINEILGIVKTFKTF